MHFLCLPAHVYMSTNLCTRACTWWCNTVSCTDRHKAIPHPPLSQSFGGGIRQSVQLPAPSRRGAGARDGRFWRSWGGDSLAMFTSWKCRLGVWRKGMSLLAFICLFSPSTTCGDVFFFFLNSINYQKFHSQTQHKYKNLLHKTHAGSMQHICCVRRAGCCI